VGHHILNTRTLDNEEMGYLYQASINHKDLTLFIRSVRRILDPRFSARVQYYPLHVTCHNNWKEATSFLLQKYPSLTEQATKHGVPLDIAYRANAHTCLLMLLKRKQPFLLADLKNQFLLDFSRSQITTETHRHYPGSVKKQYLVTAHLFLCYAQEQCEEDADIKTVIKKKAELFKKMQPEQPILREYEDHTYELYRESILENASPPTPGIQKRTRLKNSSNLFSQVFSREYGIHTGKKSEQKEIPSTIWDAREWTRKIDAPNSPLVEKSV
jgi:hypothetical protein